MRGKRKGVCHREVQNLRPKRNATGQAIHPIGSCPAGSPGGPAGLHGADVAARDEYGATPLHEAATHSRPEVIKLLLERGADASARDHRMETPLHNAITDEYGECIADLEKVQPLLAWAHTSRQPIMTVARPAIRPVRMMKLSGRCSAKARGHAGLRNPQSRGVR